MGCGDGVREKSVGVVAKGLSLARSIVDKAPIAPRSNLRVFHAVNIYEDTAKRDENPMQPIAKL